MLCNDKHSVRTVVLVVSDLNHTALIGWQYLQRLRVIPASFPAVAAVAQCYSELKHKHCRYFQTSSLIHLTANLCVHKKLRFTLKTIVCHIVSAPRPIPLRFQEPANAEISKYIASSIIAPCNTPTEWCSPAFFVPKGDGKRVRLVTDYTELNWFVVRPVHPFPFVSDIIQSIPASAASFAKLDLSLIHI